MLAAKFHVIGGKQEWLKLRLQEEIQVSGIDGSVVDVEADKIAVILEGPRKKIEDLYNHVRETMPGNAVLTGLIYGTTMKRGLHQMASPTIIEDKTSKESIDKILEYLKEMEKTLRKISRRLDAVEDSLKNPPEREYKSLYNNSYSDHSESQEIQGQHGDESYGENTVASFFDMTA